MRICRFDDNRLGIVVGDRVADVTRALDVIPSFRYPLPKTDPLIGHLAEVRKAAEEILPDAPMRSVSSVRMLSPVANPPKIIAAPVNYLKHLDEANRDKGINYGQEIKTIDHYGVFLKASTSLIGPSEGVEIYFPERRTDHEIELVAVIGREGRRIPRAKALDYVAGYAIGLDMTLRGPEDRSYRKSQDGFAVLGPWLVTADEIPDPNNLEMTITVNGEPRQHAWTRDLIFDVERLIEYASHMYRLCPGDLIYTGTPEGVGSVVPGDVMRCTIERIGSMDVAVRAGAFAQAAPGPLNLASVGPA